MKIRSPVIHTNELEVESDSKSSVSVDFCQTIDNLREDFDSDYCSEISLLDQSFNSDLNDDQISEIECFLTINEAIRKSSDLYKVDICIARPFTNYDKTYTEYEQYTLIELFQCFKSIPNSWERFEIIKINSILESPQPNNLFYEKGIRSLIEATKMLGVFQNICENDRIALVKYGSIDIICLRSILCYDLDNESWMIEMVILFFKYNLVN